ncbi:MAG: SMC family ATPase [Thermofilaceae archaeon]
MPLRLKSLEAEGFRAFDRRISIEFSDDLTVIFGPPGAGKTSLVRALEFALFGMIRELPTRNLRKEDLINDFCEEAKVRVVLTDGSTDISITRTLNRTGLTTLVVTVGNNEFRDDVAEKYLQSKLSCPFDEFVTEYSLGYQELYTLLHAPPAEQGRLFDVLLGISELEKLQREISLKDVKDALKSIEEEERKLGGESILEELPRLKSRYAELIKRRDELQAELDRLEVKRRLLEEEYSALQACSKEVEKLRLEAEKLREQLKVLESEKPVKFIEVDQSYILELAGNLKNDLCSLLEECFLGEEAKLIRDYEVSISNITSFVEMFKRLVTKVNEECILQLNYDIQSIRNRINYMESYIRKLEDDLGEIESEIEKMKSSQIEYEKIKEKYGDIPTLTKKIAQLEVKLKALQREEGRSLCIHAIQKEVMESLKNRNYVKCPVCGNQVTSFSSLPEATPPESTSLQRERIERSLSELKDAERRLRELEYSLRLLSNYEKRRSELESELERALDELRELRLNLDELEERMSILKNKLIELTKGYNQLENLYRSLRYFELREMLRKIENRLRELGYDEERVRKITEDIVKVKEAISANRELLKELERQEGEMARRIREYELASAKLKELRVRRERLELIYNRLERIKRALSDTHVALRRSLAEKLSGIASRFFVELDPSMQYDAVLISVESHWAQSGRGRYVAFVKRRTDGKIVPVATRLSDGQKSVFALSLFLAARLLKPGNLAFLVLDDPVPNVDESTHVLLAKALLRLSPGVQVILTTQSRSVAEEIARLAKVIDLSQQRASNEAH